MRVVLDTNTLIYKLKSRLAEELPDSGVEVSVISKIELLSYPDLSKSEKNSIRRLLSQLLVVPISDDIVDGAIKLRRSQRLKLADAIIAATAIARKAELWTNDVQFLKVKGLKSKVPKLTQEA